MTKLLLLLHIACVSIAYAQDLKEEKLRIFNDSYGSFDEQVNEKAASLLTTVTAGNQHANHNSNIEADDLPGDSSESASHGKVPALSASFITPTTPSPLETTTLISDPYLEDFEGYPACKRDDHKKSYCVPYYQCTENFTINYDGTGLMNPRIELNYFKWEPYSAVRRKRDLHQTTKYDDISDSCEWTLDVCCSIPSELPVFESITLPENATEKPVGCGYSNPNGVKPNNSSVAITNQTKFGEYPWVVAILKLELLNKTDFDATKLKVYVGGGSLIHPSVVLTAAFNVVDLNDLLVRAGEWDMQTNNEVYASQERSVSSVVVHKDFNRNTLYYNVALVFLSAPMDAAPHVGVACLPRANERARAGLRCFASGWGGNSYGRIGKQQNILKKVEVPIVDRESCKKILRKIHLGPLYSLHPTSLCAGGEANRDTCSGDGGAPLVCPVEHQTDRYVQNGIVSWGIGCGEEGVPAVYVDVASVRTWIDTEVISKGYDVSPYTY